MGCPEAIADVVDCIDVHAIIRENARILRENKDRTRRFPHIYQLYDATELISTFSHLTPNLPFDEVFGNYLLPKIADEAGLRRDHVINCAYDNYIPRTDTPKAYTVQFGIVNPKVLHPEIIPSLQEGFFYDPNELIKDGQNRIKSAPEENLEAFRARFDQLEAILERYAGPGDVSEKLLKIRQEFFGASGHRDHPRSCLLSGTAAQGCRCLRSTLSRRLPLLGDARARGEIYQRHVSDRGD